MSDFDALKWLGVGAAAYLLIKAVRPLAMLHVYLKQQFRYPTVRVVEAEQVPEDVRTYLEAGAEQLRELGFVANCWIQISSMEVSEFGDSYSFMLRHETLGVDGSVSAGYLGIGLRINFCAQLSDGTRLESLHGAAELLTDELVDTEIVDTPDPDVKALWRVYEARLRELMQSKQVVRLDPNAAAAASELGLKRSMDAWLERGTIQRAREPDRFELPLFAALRVSVRLARASAAMTRFRAARAALEPGLSLDSEQVRSYQQVREFTERRSARFGLVSGLLLSGVVFALSMLRLVDAEDLAALVGVLFFHELGHFAAMRLLGYRDTSIFFIPFFGAAARGIKRDASIHEQVIVLLAGPVPGIATAGLLLWFAPGFAASSDGSTVLDLLIWINLFNLLPIFPLDGGRIVQLLFARTRPMFEACFRALGALGFLALGIFSRDAVLIALGCFLGLMIPATLRAARAARGLRAREPLPGDETVRVQLALSELRRAQPSLPPMQRFAVLMPLVERMRLRPLGWLGMLSWSGVYSVSIAGGLAVLVLVVQRPPERGYAVSCGDLSALEARLPQAAGTFSFSCELEESRRTILLQTLRDYSQLPAASCLVAPWESSKLRPSVLRARATVTALQAERGRVLDARGANELDLNHTKDLGDAVRAGMQAYLAAHGDEEGLDPSVGALYVALDAPGGDDAEAALLDKLGRRDAQCVVDEQSELTVPVSGGSRLIVMGHRSNLRSGARDLVEFLCERGCDLRLDWARPQR